VKYKCECNYQFDEPVPSYSEILKLDGTTEKIYVCDCCPNCGSRNYKEVADNEL
jgi:hypothetical protein